MLSGIETSSPNLFRSGLQIYGLDRLVILFCRQQLEQFAQEQELQQFLSGAKRVGCS
jgi:hypothetical protein